MTRRRRSGAGLLQANGTDTTDGPDPPSPVAMKIAFPVRFPQNTRKSLGGLRFRSRFP